MHALRLLGFGIVIGLLLVGITAWQDPLNRGAWIPTVRAAETHESKMQNAKKWLERPRKWKISDVLELFKG